MPIEADRRQKRAIRELFTRIAARYDRKLGVGTIISMMLPYSVLFLVFWIALFFVWVFVLGLPVGPATPTYYTYE